MAEDQDYGLGEYPCAHRGCKVAVKRVGGQWWHVKKAGAHYPRPKPIAGVIAPDGAESRG